MQAIAEARAGFAVVEDDPAGEPRAGGTADLWGINRYPGESGPDWIEFDSMINLRPSQGNRSRGVDDERVQARIREVVGCLVPPE